MVTKKEALETLEETYELLSEEEELSPELVNLKQSLAMILGYEIDDDEPLVNDPELLDNEPDSDEDEDEDD